MTGARASPKTVRLFGLNINYPRATDGMLIAKGGKAERREVPEKEAAPNSSETPDKITCQHEPVNDSYFAPWAIARPFLPAAAAFSIDQEFIVGYETLAETQRDLTAELAAQTLRDQPGRHFK